MREIKFRAWDKKDNVMRIVSEIHFYHKEIEATDYPFEIPFTEIELMQYTGLKDKNGKEIYEGDIIKKDNDWDGVLRVVGYSKYEYVLYEKEQLKSGKRQDGRIFDMSSIIGSTQVYGEVIGNVYENPDLLSNQKNG